MTSLHQPPLDRATSPLLDSCAFPLAPSSASALPSAFSASTSSLGSGDGSGAVSRASSCRSSSSVVARPRRKPTREPAQAIPAQPVRGYSAIDQRTPNALPHIDTTSAQPSTSTSTLPASPGGDAPSALRKSLNDFQLREPLGEGSYSTVTKIEDKLPPFRCYALKVLDKAHIRREKKTKYVLIERDTLKQLDGHPGIVRLYWTFQDQHSLYYVLELASHGELLHAIKRVGSFSLSCAVFYAAQVASAVAFIHSHAIIHRDLKPENILLDDNDSVKITDFGTAKNLATADVGSTRPRSFVGTPEYVSPEILNASAEASYASDWWAFGCIVYQLIAGHPPFQAATEYLTFQKIIKLDYAFPAEFPPHAKDLVEKLLVLDPAQRLGSGEGGAQDIRTHPFFTEGESAVDFDSIWTRAPPPIETGIAKPKTTTTTTFELVESSSASQTSASEAGVGVVSKWSSLLSSSEVVLFASAVSVKRGFRSRARTLILTDSGRLLCIKESADRVEVKSELFVSGARAGGVAGPEFVVSAWVESDKTFNIKTNLRTLRYEVSSGLGAHWAAELAERAAQATKTP